MLLRCVPGAEVYTGQVPLSVITLLPKAEAMGWQRKEGRKPGQPVNHREIQNGEACLAVRVAPQPCAQCGVGAHVKDLPVYVTWSQFAFSYALYVS